jgi:signal peptide peptidase SppA
VTGVPELADEIAKMRGAMSAKPMAAFNGGMMASAAYWLGAAAGDITAAPSAVTGSIGVYTWHEDLTEFLKNEGIKVTEISAGEFKTEGAPWKPLTAEGQAHDQAMVDHFYGLFVKSVAHSRSATQTAVREGFGRGRVETTPEALKASLVDRVGTFEDALARLAGKVSRPGAKGRRASALSRALALDVDALSL